MCMVPIVKTVQVILSPEYQTREEFLQYSHLLTLDLNSVNKRLRLSKRNKLITVTDTDQPYPDHPDRFEHWWQAMCRKRVTGRCYWEVEWSSSDGRSGVSISVTYKSMNRKGNSRENVSGNNDQSWRLFCCPDYCSFGHNNIETVLPVVPSSRIGVYVDHGAGILSFYSVSDTMSLIHRVQATFTQPLYAMIGLDNHTSVKLCRLTN
ncbi:unnamed protein product [Leuciscus chuanchicus]